MPAEPKQTPVVSSSTLRDRSRYGGTSSFTPRSAAARTRPRLSQPCPEELRYNDSQVLENFLLTDEVRPDSAVAEPPRWLMTGEVPSVRRKVALGGCRYIVVVARVHRRVPEGEYSGDGHVGVQHMQE